LWCWMNTFSVMLYLRGHQQFVMRCGFLLVESCMVTCLVFNSEDYSCVICWLFNPYLLQFIGARKWKKSRSILLLSLVNLTYAPAPIAGRYWRERKCVARRTVRGDTQECL
jgi:hypothetical protein